MCNAIDTNNDNLYYVYLYISLGSTVIFATPKLALSLVRNYINRNKLIHTDLSRKEKEIKFSTK